MNHSVRLKISHSLIAIISAILVFVPFYAFFTVWLASNTGHYTAWRLSDEFLLIMGVLLALVLIFMDKTIWQSLNKRSVMWLITAYIVLQLIMGLIALGIHNVSTKALGYGLIINLRFLAFFVVCFVAAYRSAWLKKHWQQLVLFPALIVVLFGLLQHFVLPYNFLSHFGYGLNTIPAYETINNDLRYVRIGSTLRGANPLGAYLIIVVSSLSVLMVRAKNHKVRLALGAFLLATLYVLYLSFSRSAWIGVVLSLVIVLGLSLPKYARWWFVSVLSALLILGGVTYVIFRNNIGFENIFFHTNQNSAIHTTSDQGHASLLKQGLREVVHQPFGLGPGTAGPASVYNNQPRIAENYFVQVAQEIGWAGLIIFLLINWLVGRELWRKRNDPLALSLLAALIGISFVNLLSHAWADDTLSYIWWGLAAVAITPVLSETVKHAKN